MTQGVEIEHSVVCDVSAVLAVFDRFPREERVILEDLELEWRANALILLVAICHQTSPMKRERYKARLNGEEYIGWDLLVECVRRSPWITDPGTWSDLSVADFDDVFQPSGSTALVDKEERVFLIHDLGDFLGKHEYSTMRLISHCALRLHREANASRGIVDELKTCVAYSDPARKKIYFLMSLLESCCDVQFVDRPSMEAPIDYHELRGHLRIGTIRVTDADLAGRIERQERITTAEDIALRLAARDVVRILADGNGATPDEIHYLLWNIFRTICTRGNPMCSGPTDVVAEPYRSLLRDAGHHGCPFNSFCAAFSSGRFVVEPSVNTNYY